MSHPWLIVPVKPFAEGKSRLSEELPPAERARLSRRLLHHVLTTAAIDDLFPQTIVVSRDPGAAKIAEGYGAMLLAEEGGELNAALEQARELALRQGATAILVLPADLPHLSADHLAK
jgi:2-phospho-L-lactate guanylyltransferase